MKKKFSKFLGVGLALVLVASFSLVTAVPAGAYSYVDYTNAITKTANRLVALQSDVGGLLSPPDYGWDWIVTGLTQHSINASASNLYGVTALGLIDANEETGDPSYLAAAGFVADMMIGYGTGYEAFKAAGLGHSFDLRFLMSYAEATDGTSYSDFAKNYWDWVKAREAPNVYADGSQEDFYQVYTSLVSPGYAMWGCVDFGLAALAMEDTSWASDMAAVLAGHLTEITDTDGCRFIGWGHALEFLNAVDSTTYGTEIGDLITNLTGSQNAADGSWPGTVDQGRVQNTAYAVMGLAAAGGADAIAAAEKGTDWLVTHQDYDIEGTIEGGWLDPDEDKEYSQVDSEALQAIKAVLDISGLTYLSAAYIPSIGISVTPLAVDFGSVTPGTASATKTVTITNTGNVAEDFSASLADELPPDVYTPGLKIAGFSVDTWVAGPINCVSEIADAGTITPELILTVPTGTDPGTYTATLIFWAEAAQ